MGVTEDELRIASTLLEASEIDRLRLTHENAFLKAQAEEQISLAKGEARSLQSALHAVESNAERQRSDLRSQAVVAEQNAMRKGAELAESAVCRNPSLAQSWTGGQLVPTEAAQTALFAVEEDCERMRKIISEMDTERTMNVNRMAHLRIEVQTANNAALKLQTTGSVELQ